MPTVEDILDDIEFELIQGTILSDELSQSVQALRQYQNKLRSELFATPRKLDREAVARLFQVNDMLLTVLQEMATALEASRRVQHRPATQCSSVSFDTVALNALMLARDPHQIERVMREDAIHVDLQVRLRRLPFIGRLIERAQIFFHRPALFYTHLLADRQASVNRTLGDWVLSLHEHQVRQATEMEQLRARLATLEARATRDNDAV